MALTKITGEGVGAVDSLGDAITIDSNDTERFRIDSSGNLMGKTADVKIGADAGSVLFGTVGANSVKFIANDTERMRIDASGNVLVGKTSSSGSNAGAELRSNGRVFGTSDGVEPLFLNRLTSNGTIATFRKDGSEVGTISVTGSSTSYNTSSDYRLKENVTPTWDATTRLKQLNPVRFNFIADADTTVDGFLAHEAGAVVPECVSGTHNEVEVWKDGEELPDGVSVGDNKLDDDGNTIPVYQGIDQSKLVPLLVKTIQELEARITALEAV